jgi:ABC-2 type transport system ATP-binding protein
MNPALSTTRLGKRYGKKWALRECTLEVPPGRVAGLVGPNGAGKTTLLHLACGLLPPTEGSVSVLGKAPAQDVDALSRVGFVAQAAPLYGGFMVGEMLEFGRRLNRRWDDAVAAQRMERAGLSLDERVSALSGGQHAQLSLTLALAKRPDLLLLDEPLASLDPLARREFLQTLMEEIAEGDMTVVLSSHLIADLERVCDYLIVLAASRTQVVGDIEELLRSHKVLTGPPRDVRVIPGVASVVQVTRAPRQTTVLARVEGPIPDPAWTVADVGLEELVLAYLGQPDVTALPTPPFRAIRSEVNA